MSTQPTRSKLEPGIYERLAPDGERLGLEIIWKDAAGKTRRRTVHGGVQAARDQLTIAKGRRVRREPEARDPRVTFDAVADAFEATHVAPLRPNSRRAYASALIRLRKTFGNQRMTAITRLDVRAFVAAETAEGLKAWTIHSHLGCLSAIYSFARDDLDMPVTMPRLKRTERPQPNEDAREHRVLTDDELARALEACDERARLFFRFVAETGARKSEALSLTPFRVNVKDATVTFAEQLGRDGKLAPLKTRNSRRTIEITRSLAAALALASGPERVFEHLTADQVDGAWQDARKTLARPVPVVHDLRHTHVSGLIADGWDPVEVAARIGDTLATTLGTYSHEFDARRRGDQRRQALEARYPGRMATDTPQQTATAANRVSANVADLQAVREGAR